MSLSSYEQSVNKQRFNHECGVATVEMYDDYIVVTTRSGREHKFHLDDMQLFSPLKATVKEGKAP